jgi:Rad3-related DNA helicase
VRRALALPLAAALVLGGCGGESKRLSRAEYAQKADAICADGNRRTERLPTPTNLPELAEVTEDTRNILDDAIDELRKLRPPSDEENLAKQWLAQLEQLTDDLAEIRDGARANDRDAIRTVAERTQSHNNRANELATTLGMKVCYTTN